MKIHKNKHWQTANYHTASEGEHHNTSHRSKRSFLCADNHTDGECYSKNNRRIVNE